MTTIKTNFQKSIEKLLDNAEQIALNVSLTIVSQRFFIKTYKWLLSIYYYFNEIKIILAQFFLL